MYVRLDNQGVHPVAFFYLAGALDFMQRHALRRDRIDWPAIRRRALLRSAKAQIPSDTYPALQAAVAELGDRHSAFVPPSMVSSSEASHDIALPSGQLLPAGVSHLGVPSFVGTDRDGAYAGHLRRALHKLVPSVVRRQVVDLRANEGGNMWPMVTGLGPLLGDGLIGTFVSPDRQSQVWSYLQGQASLDQMVMARADPDVPLLSRDRVAVLISAQTRSAGEAVVVAFQGRPATRSFGAPTSGVQTSNVGKRMSDGALLLVGWAWDADRNGRIYNGPIVPDQTVDGAPSSPDSAHDAVLAAAVSWLGDLGEHGG